jgi:tetratricopeptide (TPR) repeat protein
MPEDIMLQEAVEAIRQGQRGRARDLLTRLLRADATNTQYWLWMSSVVETPKEQIYCLQSILKVDPKNRAARQGLVLLGAMPPETEVKPVPPVKRRWQVEVQEVRDISGLRAIWANPYVSLTVLAVAAFGVIALIGLGLYYQGLRRKPIMSVFPTRTPGPSPTFTYTPTAINETERVPTARPTLSGPPPLQARLQATYTATPVYVNTPHTSNEAFRFAQRAYERGDIASALVYLRQARQVSPDAADIPYFQGEIYRQQGDHNQALEAYNAALAINTHFAPAQLGAARVQMALNPKADISVEIRQAIQNDPNLKEAYLELASFLLTQNEAQEAVDVLNRAADLLAESPLLYLRRAEAELALGDGAGAYEDAVKANQMDQTLLESYRLLAQTAARTQHFGQALEAVKVYLIYEQKNPDAWLIQGIVLYGQGNFSLALESLDMALELDNKLPEARLYHGLSLMELGQGQDAVNEIYLALQSDPRSFDLNLYFSRSLLVAGRLGDALGQVNRAYDLAVGDAQRAQALFWRAKIYEAIGNMPAAIRDWKRIVALPTGSVPQEQMETAQAHIETTSTPVPTATRTPSVTPTPRPSRTLTPSRTPRPVTSTPTSGPTTSTASLTVTVSLTPVPTSTPTPK